MDNQRSAEELRREMELVRGDLADQLEGTMDNARQLTDWRYYVKSYPLGALALVTAVGYLVVPRKLQIMSPDADTLAKLAKRNQLVVEHKPRAERRPGLMETILNLTGSMILRAGTAYVGHKFGQLLGDDATQPEEPRPEKTRSS